MTYGQGLTKGAEYQFVMRHSARHASAVNAHAVEIAASRSGQRLLFGLGSDEGASLALNGGSGDSQCSARRRVYFRLVVKP